MSMLLHIVLTFSPAVISINNSLHVFIWFICCTRDFAQLFAHQVAKVSVLICFAYNWYFLEVKKVAAMNGSSGSMDHTDSVSNGNHTSKNGLPVTESGHREHEPQGKYLWVCCLCPSCWSVLSFCHPLQSNSALCSLPFTLTSVSLQFERPVFMFEPTLLACYPQQYNILKSFGDSW